MTVDEIIVEFEKELELERELGVRRIELDRSLLVTAPAPTPAPVPCSPSPVPHSPRVLRSHGEGGTPVPQNPSPAAEVVVPQSDRHGIDLVFVVATPGELAGAAGELLDKMIAAMGFSRIEAPVLCYDASLAAKLADLNPRIVVLVGSAACKKLLPGRKMAIGSWVNYGTAAAVAIPAPGYMLRFYADDPAGLRKMKSEAWNTLKLVLARLGRTPPARK